MKRGSIFFAILVMGLTVACVAGRADTLPLGLAANYAVLYEGTGGHNLQITNVTINGSIGVGGTGAIQDGGPSTIVGAIDFSAANAGSGFPTYTGSQFHNNNTSNSFTPALSASNPSFSNANVSTALTTVNNLNTSLVGQAGTNLAIVNGNTTVNASSGTLDVVNGHSYRVFTVTSYSQVNGNVFTINGDAAGDIVVFNFSMGVNLGGDTTLNGLTPDQVLWNFTGTGNVQLNNNASSFPNVAFQGVILAPGNVMSMTNANLTGRLFGGDSGDMQIVSGDTLTAPAATPEPASMTIFGSGLLMIGGLLRKRVTKRSAHHSASV